MYLMVLTIGVVHILLILYCIITNKIKSELNYTSDLKEYSRCYYPKSKKIW
eukprot:jgi/Orpsp1_1/1180482/evm.model.c7180000073585.1